MITTLKSFKTVGIQAVPVTVETEIATSNIGIHLVGLADTAARESLLRTVTALQANGYNIPGKKIVINLAPADLRKSGCGFDLPIALAVIGASEQAQFLSHEKYLIAGELGLDGSVRSVPGCVQALFLAKREGLSLIMPKANAEELLPFAGGVEVYPVNTLGEAVKVLTGKTDEVKELHDLTFPREEEKKPLAWDLIHAGNVAARRALEIAASGGHNIIFMGAPGSGKSTCAKALAELLPPLGFMQSAVTAGIYSLAGNIKNRDEKRPPFRAPHCSISFPALLGGGTSDDIRPGEVSLAHNGVLFFDDFEEMPKAVSEALRGPLEDKEVKITRLKTVIEYPAHFQLVAATNPCPCGYYGVGDRCTCTPAQRAAYLSHLSGPVMDHIAMQVWLNPTNAVEDTCHEDIEDVRKRVQTTREKQLARQGCLNDELTAQRLEEVIGDEPETKVILDKIITHLGLSARSYTRILRLARTIADMDGNEKVMPVHVAEASSFRYLDRITTTV